MYFDTHAHYDDERFDEDRDAVLSSMAGGGVELVLNAAPSPWRRSTLSYMPPWAYIPMTPRRWTMAPASI